jgi:hypothetical protein
MTMNDQPGRLRVGVALLVAPAIPALAFSLVSPAYEGLPNLADRVWRTFEIVTVVGGYLPTLVLGLPAILIFKRRLRPTVLNCAVAGACVAALPWAVLVALSRPDEADIGGRATVIHGVPTLFGLFEDGKFVSMIAALGVLGGVAFWLLGVFDPRPRRATA